MKARIAVLVSGGGTNLQALLDAQVAGALRSGEVVLVVSDQPGAYALERARSMGVEAAVLTEDFEAQLRDLLEARDIDLVVLAGFMRILSADFTADFDRRLINVLPSLIPACCGKGFYGLRVHRAALDYGVKVTGATVHFVNEIPDGGEIIAQKAVPVHPDDTPETLQRRVMEEAEWVLLPRACEMISEQRSDR